MPEHRPVWKELTLIAAADVALWRLPRWLRKTLVAPVVLVLGVRDAADAARDEFVGTWRWGMDKVHDRSEVTDDQ